MPAISRQKAKPFPRSSPPILLQTSPHPKNSVERLKKTTSTPFSFQACFFINYCAVTRPCRLVCRVSKEWQRRFHAPRESRRNPTTAMLGTYRCSHLEVWFVKRRVVGDQEDLFFLLFAMPYSRLPQDPAAVECRPRLAIVFCSEERSSAGVVWHLQTREKSSSRLLNQETPGGSLTYLTRANAHIPPILLIFCVANREPT